LPLSKWFAAISLMCDAKKGISANQLQRHIDVTYKTAWYVAHRIREGMREARDRRWTGSGCGSESASPGSGRGRKPLYLKCPGEIREINASTGLISRVAGIGYPGSSGDGGAAQLRRSTAPIRLRLMLRAICTSRIQWIKFAK
jgi:hypothetical protein